MGKVRPWTLGIIAWFVLSGLVVGCGGDDPEPSREDSGTKRTTTVKERSPRTTETTETKSTTTTTSPFGDTIDLADAPPVLFSTGEAVVYFADVMDEPEYRAGPAEQGETLLLSPDATMVAVATPGDAVRPARIQLISIDTGKAVQTFDVDLDRVNMQSWSPDGKAIAVQGPNGWLIQRVDGTTQEVVARSSRVVFTSDGSQVSAVDCESCSSTQVVGAKRVPVSVSLESSTSATVAGIYNVGSRVVDPLEGEWGKVEIQTAECTQFTVITGYIDGQKDAILDIDKRKVWPVDAVKRNNTCPVASFDGAKVAVALSAGGTAVVDMATGTSTVVARQGVPLAWSKDGKKLAVQGNGTFLVGPDGSGGKEASVVVKRFCQLGETGTLLAEVTGSTAENSGLAIYDIAADSASLIGGGFNLGASCDLSEDGSWVLTGEVIVSLEKRAAAFLRRTTADGFNIRGELRFPGGLSTSPRVATGA